MVAALTCSVHFLKGPSWGWGELEGTCRLGLGFPLLVLCPASRGPGREFPRPVVARWGRAVLRAQLYLVSPHSPSRSLQTGECCPANRLNCRSPVKKVRQVSRHVVICAPVWPTSSLPTTARSALTYSTKRTYDRGGCQICLQRRPSLAGGFKTFKSTLSSIHNPALHMLALLITLINHLSTAHVMFSICFPWHISLRAVHFSKICFTLIWRHRFVAPLLYQLLPKVYMTIK